jgi:hypothetical protein
MGDKLTGEQKDGERRPCYTQTRQAWSNGDRSLCLRRRDRRGGESRPFHPGLRVVTLTRSQIVLIINWPRP